MPVQVEKRRERRLDIKMPATLRIGSDRSEPGRLANLSKGGAMVQLYNTDPELRVDQPVDLVIQWSAPSSVTVEPETIAGYVRHMGPGTSMGIEFDRSRKPAA